MMVGNSNSAGKGEEHDSPSTTAADGGYGYLSSSSLGVEDGIPPGQAGGLDDDYYLS
jgi:hypothetical protein